MFAELCRDKLQTAEDFWHFARRKLGCMISSVQPIGNIMGDQSKREIEIFNSALEQATLAKRAAYLDRACREGGDLRARISASKSFWTHFWTK